MQWDLRDETREIAIRTIILTEQLDRLQRDAERKQP
jgi:hypothetical protein